MNRKGLFIFVSILSVLVWYLVPLIYIYIAVISTILAMIYYMGKGDD